MQKKSVHLPHNILMKYVMLKETVSYDKINKECSLGVNRIEGVRFEKITAPSKNSVGEIALYYEWTITLCNYFLFS